jgi:hypothetical protein
MNTNTALFFQGHALTVGLAARELYTLMPDDEVRLACVSGSLWVTLDHDRRDIILERGQNWTMPARRRCVIYALEASDAQMVAIAAARAPARSN